MKKNTTILTYDTINENGRIYTKEVVLKMIDRFKEFPQGMFGELNHPESSIVSLANVSHIVTELRLNENSKTLECSYETLSTPNGILLSNLLKITDIDLGPRGTGIVNEKTKEVEEYELIAFDALIKQ